MRFGGRSERLVSQGRAWCPLPGAHGRARRAPSWPRPGPASRHLPRAAPHVTPGPAPARSRAPSPSGYLNGASAIFPAPGTERASGRASAEVPARALPHRATQGRSAERYRRGDGHR